MTCRVRMPEDELEEELFLLELLDDLLMTGNPSLSGATAVLNEACLAACPDITDPNVEPVPDTATWPVNRPLFPKSRHAPAMEDDQNGIGLGNPESWLTSKP